MRQSCQISRIMCKHRVASASTSDDVDRIMSQTIHTKRGQRDQPIVVSSDTGAAHTPNRAFLSNTGGPDDLCSNCPTDGLYTNRSTCFFSSSNTHFGAKFPKYFASKCSKRHRSCRALWRYSCTAEELGNRCIRAQAKRQSAEYI